LQFRSEVDAKDFISARHLPKRSVYAGATMAVAMKESWTDDRLDDFRGEVNRRFDEAAAETNRRFDEAAAETNRRFDEAAAETNRRFDEVDKRFDRFEADVDRRFDKVDRGFGEVNSELSRLDSKLDGLQRTMVLTGGGIIATLIAGIISLVVTQI
jgi:hypothetical protein